MGSFVMPFTQFSVKIGAVVVFGFGFAFVMFLTRFSRSMIYFALSIALILYIDFYLVHVDHSGVAHGINLSVVDFLVMVLIARRVIFSHEYVKIDTVDKHWNHGIWAALFLLITFSLSIVNSQYPTLTFYALIHYIKLFVFLLVVVFDVLNENDLTNMITFFTIALLVINLYCMFQFITRINITVSFQVHEDPIWYEGPFVPVGPVGSANITAGQIIGLAPFALATAFRHPHWVFRLGANLILLLSTFTLVLTNSRASWGMYLVSMVLMLFILTLKKKISYKYLVAVAILGVLVIAVAIPIVVQKVDVSELTDLKNIYARFNLLRTSFMMVMDHPLLGVGLNTYTKLMMEYIPSIVLKFEWNYMVHNKYMLVWSETGTLGFIAYLTFLATIYKLLLSSIRNLNGDLIWVAVSIFCSLVAMNLHMLFETYSGGSIVFFFWLLCGLAIALSRITTSTVYQTQ